MAAAPRHTPSKAAAHPRHDCHLNGAANGIDSIWKACAYGDHDKLWQIVEQRPELVNQVL